MKNFSSDKNETINHLLSVIKELESKLEAAQFQQEWVDYKSQYNQMIDNAKTDINKHLSNVVISVANDNNITCYRSGKVYKFAFMEDLRYVLPTDLLKLADSLNLLPSPPKEK